MFSVALRVGTRIILSRNKSSIADATDVHYIVVGGGPEKNTVSMYLTTKLLRETSRGGDVTRVPFVA